MPINKDSFIIVTPNDIITIKKVGVTTSSSSRPPRAYGGLGSRFFDYEGMPSGRVSSKFFEVDGDTWHEVLYE